MAGAFVKSSQPQEEIGLYTEPPVNKAILLNKGGRKVLHIQATGAEHVAIDSYAELEAAYNGLRDGQKIALNSNVFHSRDWVYGLGRKDASADSRQAKTLSIPGIIITAFAFIMVAVVIGVIANYLIVSIKKGRDTDIKQVGQTGTYSVTSGNCVYLIDSAGQILEKDCEQPFAEQAGSILPWIVGLVLLLIAAWWAWKTGLPGVREVQKALTGKAAKIVEKKKAAGSPKAPKEKVKGEVSKRPPGNPSKKIHWRSIPDKGKVLLMGKEGSQAYYYGSKQVYWTGQEAKEAQAWLNDKLSSSKSEEK